MTSVLCQVPWEAGSFLRSVTGVNVLGVKEAELERGWAELWYRHHRGLGHPLGSRDLLLSGHCADALLGEGVLGLGIWCVRARGGRLGGTQREPPRMSWKSRCPEKHCS